MTLPMARLIIPPRLSDETFDRALLVTERIGWIGAWAVEIAAWIECPLVMN